MKVISCADYNLDASMKRCVHEFHNEQVSARCHFTAGGHATHMGWTEDEKLVHWSTAEYKCPRCNWSNLTHAEGCEVLLYMQKVMAEYVKNGEHR